MLKARFRSLLGLGIAVVTLQISAEGVKCKPIGVYMDHYSVYEGRCPSGMLNLGPVETQEQRPNLRFSDGTLRALREYGNQKELSENLANSLYRVLRPKEKAAKKNGSREMNSEELTKAVIEALAVVTELESDGVLSEKRALELRTNILSAL